MMKALCTGVILKNFLFTKSIFWQNLITMPSGVIVSLRKTIIIK